MSIFVGNLPFRAEQEDVAELFAPFGEVVNCSLPLERDIGRKRGFAFIEMADAEMESRAIEALQGSEYSLQTRALAVEALEKAGSPQAPTMRRRSAEHAKERANLIRDPSLWRTFMERPPVVSLLRDEELRSGARPLGAN